jgi:hypothetical protein
VKQAKDQAEPPWPNFSFAVRIGFTSEKSIPKTRPGVRVGLSNWLGLSRLRTVEVNLEGSVPLVVALGTRLARRPGHRPPTQDMTVQVRDRFPGMRAVVDHQPIPGILQPNPRRHFGRFEQQIP